MQENEQRALDEQCAHALGYDTIWADGGFGLTLYLWDKDAVRTPTGTSNCRGLGAQWERVRVNDEVCELMVRICPGFAGRMEDAVILEKEVNRRGLIQEYTLALAKICNITGMQTFNPVVYTWYDLWCIAQAAPEQRARAFLEVIPPRLSDQEK